VSLRRFDFKLVLLLWLGCGVWAQAQAVPGQAGSAAQISLGQAAAPLFGPWKFQAGDSPLDPSTHVPLWAQPGFDDSSWESVDLKPENGTFDPWNGPTGYVQGWTGKGHARYSGYAWYRLRVHLETQSGEKLALAGPLDVDDAFQVFDNGSLVGSFGDFSGAKPAIYYSQPTMFRLPDSAAGNLAPLDLVLVFRVWMGPKTLLTQPGAGGLHSAPLLGSERAIGAAYQLRWQKLVRAYTPLAFEALFFVLLAVMAFSLTLFDKTDPAYLWMGTIMFWTAIDYLLAVLSSWTTYVSVLVPTLLRDDLLTPLICAGWVIVWWIWFRLHRPAWVPRAAQLLAVLLFVSNIVAGELVFSFIPHSVAAGFAVASLVIRLLLYALLVWVVILGVRRRGRESWPVLLAVAFCGLGQFQREHSVLHIRLGGFPMGFELSIAQISNLLMAGVLGLLLLQRLLISLREQRLMAQDINQRLLQSGQEQCVMALELKQAQEVQQVILPEARTTLPGLVIESEYRPARAVGGDFFQVIPLPIDGSLLIVAGDVTGKGLKAGMMVAFLVGAIRSTVDWSADPAVLLKALNKRLVGRGDAQATCLAMRISAEGEVVLANAGHIPPYLNGDMLAIEGAFPLGFSAELDLSVQRFKLAEGDRLVLMSDGIAEAMDANGQLFGFERALDLVRRARSAAEVASAAQRFGQEDDISVISVTRTAVWDRVLA
jgi:hypothetical protein